MADTTITITIPEAQFPVLQNALANSIGAASPDAADIKTHIINGLKQSVKDYNRKNSVVSSDGTTDTITYSTFTPS